ncbi:hypothetical protein BDN71DRAFT_1426713 [Pleurotus eryngii]|uniref:Uncharacterized protein n=1 Tax=Pleurotus eryngii TaxID=5323 RepID=A0A9P6A8R9_PLEER|nr:hypothetical protein BDN71DRAFT_1426713 [Pleurotus eryngii]
MEKGKVKATDITTSPLGKPLEEIMVHKISALKKKCAVVKSKEMVGSETDEVGEASPCCYSRQYSMHYCWASIDNGNALMQYFRFGWFNLGSHTSHMWKYIICTTFTVKNIESTLVVFSVQVSCKDRDRAQKYFIFGRAGVYEQWLQDTLDLSVYSRLLHLRKNHSTPIVDGSDNTCLTTSNSWNTLKDGAGDSSHQQGGSIPEEQKYLAGMTHGELKPSGGPMGAAAAEGVVLPARGALAGAGVLAGAGAVVAASSKMAKLQAALGVIDMSAIIESKAVGKIISREGWEHDALLTLLLGIASISIIILWKGEGGMSQSAASSTPQESTKTMFLKQKVAACLESQVKEQDTLDSILNQYFKCFNCPAEEVEKKKVIVQMKQLITSWFHYCTNKINNSLRHLTQATAKSTKDPFVILLGQLTGLACKPPKCLAAWKYYGKQLSNAIKETFKTDFHKSGQDQKLCLDKIGNFFYPIIDGIKQVLNMHVTVLIGGPEPAKGGQLNIPSLHSEMDLSAVLKIWGDADIANYCMVTEKFKAYLWTVYNCHDAQSSRHISWSEPNVKKAKVPKGHSKAMHKVKSSSK